MTKEIFKNIGIFTLLISSILVAPKPFELFLSLTNKSYKSSKKMYIFNSRLTAFNHNLNPDWRKLIINKDLQIPQIKDNDWSYPWYIIRHADGHFENTFGELIKHSDTLRLIHNSNCYSFEEIENVINKEPRSRLKFAKAILSNDTLKINLFDHSASNWESLSFLVFKDKFKSNYRTNYVFDYIDIDYFQKDSKLVLNKEPPFSIGQTIKGKVFHKIEEQILFSREGFNKKEGRIIKGTFEVKIE